MPLHDWANQTGWEGVHQVWCIELLYALKPILPPGYRVVIGRTPTFTAPPAANGHPDVSVRDWEAGGPAGPLPAGEEPDEVAVLTLPAVDATVNVERAGRLVAVIELVPPGNKNRVTKQDGYGSIYASYLVRGVHLLLIDVHPRPAGFSFADRIADEIDLTPPGLPAPFAACYRVGDPDPRFGSELGMWRRLLTVGQPLPTMHLPLSEYESVPVDLEATYRRAAEASYLD